MPSKRTKRTCSRKHPYSDEQTAQHAAARLRKDSGIMFVYRCPVHPWGKPRHWHVGRRR